MEKYEENQSERTKYILKIIGITMMYTIITEILFFYTEEGQRLVFGKLIIANWGLGLIFTIAFIFFYIVNDLPLFLFRANKFNKFMILFWVSWVIGDWRNFLTVIYGMIF